MWSGAVNAIPAGWALCNGENGTPDLRNRFIVGAGDEYSVGDTGGVESYTFYGRRYITTGTVGGNAYTKTDSMDGPETWTMDNRPPYYALCYIMKL